MLNNGSVRARNCYTRAFSWETSSLYSASSPSPTSPEPCPPPPHDFSQLLACRSLLDAAAREELWCALGVVRLTDHLTAL